MPTYTNIWRIEKRLYKLYDLRLPTPLPIVWVGVFVGVVVPWSVLLRLVGVPFESPWHVLYMVPPGVVTWLSTRPVIESKRLNELLQSQVRYLGEPRTWCRLAPVEEPDEITLTARVWRTSPVPVRAGATAAAGARSRRGTRAKPRHTAPRRRPLEAWNAARAVPSVKPAARVEPAPLLAGEVRPAVAAAAAAVTTTAAEAPARVQERPRVTWGGLVTESAAPPASRAATPAAPERLAIGAVPPAAETLGPLAPPAPVPVSRPAARALHLPSSQPPATTPPPPEPAAAPEPAASGEAEQQPIGTEALRRLRRLAASAEARRTAEHPAPPGPAAVPNPTTSEQAAPERAVPSRGLAVEAPRPGQERLVSAKDAELLATLGAEAAEAAEQHRKGQPPRPAQAARVPEVRTARSGRPLPGETAASRGPATPQRSAGRTPVRPGSREPAPPLSIRAVPTSQGATADPAAPSVPVPVPRPGDEPRVRRVESVVGRDQSGGWRRIAQVVVGGGGPGRGDGTDSDEARARTPLTGSRRVLVLGCSGGAGQTTTALMLGHTLARHRDDRVLAVDANVGDHTLTSRVPIDSPETLTSLLAGLDGVNGYLGIRAYTTRCESGLEVVASDSDTAASRRLADRGLFSDQRLAQTVRLLDRHYRLVLMDPAAAVAARLLPYADQLVLVAPASEDASEAVAMTLDWLDGHGAGELRRRGVLVINGVSRRSMGGVEQAEAVARGRCRAIVRVPWDDELAPGRPGAADPAHVRAGTRRAYLALAGVVASGLAVANRPSEEEVAQ
nr:TcpE family conjugal transfer membrane protein [Sphaerisporangium rubeum]